ncbi:MAG: DoxX family protein, partial [Lapillicoccus sp.]
GSGTATLAKVPAVVTNITAVGWPADRLWVLAVLKILGAVGLVVGLWVAPIGIAAAVGVALYFVGAVVFHLRAKEYSLAPPVGLLVLAIVALVLRSATR